MIEFKKTLRSKGKFTKDLSTKNFYKEYCRVSLAKKRIPVDYNVFYKVIRDFNTRLVDKIVSEAKSFKMPYKLGYLGIIKYEVKYEIENIKRWKVNYGESRKQGMIIYYDQPFRYKWIWDKKGLALKGKRYYKFTPCRTASRLIPKQLGANPGFDYYEMLSKTVE